MKRGLAISLTEHHSGLVNLLSFLKFTTPGAITAIVETKVNQTFKMVYVTNDTEAVPYQINNTIYYNIGKRQSWSRFTRNLDIDLQKALRIMEGKLTMEKLKTRIVEGVCIISKVRKIVLHGKGSFVNMSLSNTAHMEHFLDTADWTVDNMDDRGGWPVNSSRILGKATLKAGWYSALGQGLGLSTLARAYGNTGNEKYLTGALKSAKLFDVPSGEGGIRATFLNKYNWYEEYPTTPSSFVLNGHITALFGLYDLSQMAPSPQNEDAKRLYKDGINSLESMLPLYDTGSRSIYDLTHFTMSSAPNVARWDYHNLHIMLLMNLHTIEKAAIINETITRWTNYRFGITAGTN